MSKTISSTVFMLIGSVATCAVFMFLGASHPPTDNAHYHVDFDTLEFGAQQLSIEITDSQKKKAYLYVVPQPTKLNARGDSPVVEHPPRLIASINLASAGNDSLDAEILEGFLPVRQVIDIPAPSTEPKVPNFELKDRVR